MNGIPVHEEAEDNPEDVEEIDSSFEEYNPVDDLIDSASVQDNGDNPPEYDSDGRHSIDTSSTRSFVLRHGREIILTRFGAEIANDLRNLPQEEFYMVFNGLLGRSGVVDERNPENLAEEIQEISDESLEDDEEMEPGFTEIIDLSNSDEGDDNSAADVILILSSESSDKDSVSPINYIIKHRPGLLQFCFGAEIETNLENMSLKMFYNCLNKLNRMDDVADGNNSENLTEDIWERDVNTAKDDEIMDLDFATFEAIDDLDEVDDIDVLNGPLSPTSYSFSHGSKFLKFFFGTEIEANLRKMSRKNFYNAFDSLFRTKIVLDGNNQKHSAENIREDDDDDDAPKAKRTKTTVTIISNNNQTNEVSSSSNIC